MNRTLLGVVSLAGAMIAAIWVVNGPLQPSESRDSPNAMSANQQNVSAPNAATSPTATVIAGDATYSRLLPATSIDEVLALSHDFSETHAAYALAATADEAALRELIADAQRVERRGDRVALTSIFISRYGEIDPAAALEFVLDSGFDSKRDHLFMLFNGWSKVDLDAAMAATIALDADEDRRVAAEAILGAYVDTDPQTVAAIAARLMAAGISGAPASPGSPAMPPGSPAEALAVAMALPRNEATVLVANIGRSWALEDPEAAFAYSRTIADATLSRRMVAGVFNSWFQRDPESVLGLLDSQLTNDERDALINNTGFSRFIQTEPRRALELTSQILNSATRQSALQRVFTSWAEADAEAAALAVGSVEGANRETLRAMVGREYARQAPAAALEWAGGIGGQTLPTVIGEIARRDPSLALDTALSLDDPGVQQMAIMATAHTLVEDDMTKATAFLQRLPSEHRDTATQLIVVSLVQRDPEAAASWVSGLAPGPDRQQALVPLLSTLSRSGEVTDFPQLLAMLESSEQRDVHGHNRIISLLRNEGRQAAEAELSRFSLSPEGYRRVREAIDRGADSAEYRFDE